jgi:2,3-bisphosphoglycerate-independent phosphoglycerate mutase
MSIFDYDLFRNYRGRALSSLGSGMDMDYGEIAFKCNFAHMDLVT